MAANMQRCINVSVRSNLMLEASKSPVSANNVSIRPPGLKFGENNPAHLNVPDVD